MRRMTRLLRKPPKNPPRNKFFHSIPAGGQKCPPVSDCRKTKERGKALSHFHRPRRRVRRGRGDFLRRKIPFSRAKIASLQFPRPEIRRISAETGGGARRPPPVAETGRSKPNEQGRAASELVSAAERPLRIEGVAVAGGARSARHRAGHARIRIKQRAVKIPEKFANHRFPLPFSEFFSMRPRISCFRFLFATILWDPSHISNGTIT